MDLSIKLGERIRIIRKEKELSQEELGEHSGLHTNYIGAVERGEKNLTIDSIIKISKGLNISLEELFRYLDPKDHEDDLDRLVHLLSQRTKSDHSFALKLIQEIFEWEEKKQ
jgi:XRE family transcriptional regulator, regulator of sulfur utilization